MPHFCTGAALVTNTYRRAHDTSCLQIASQFIPASLVAATHSENNGQEICVENKRQNGEGEK
jgi:hypothetical protein